MAERPVFIPSRVEVGFVKEIRFNIFWHSGFSVVQKKRNIKALHEASALAGYAPLLEISTKSDERLGQHLSAFHLRVRNSRIGDAYLECAYQGSKVFEGGGPFTDLYRVDPRGAKRDPRLQQSGRLVGFKFDDKLFPLEPKTVFYDWLYISAIFPHREWLKRLDHYVGFTDIEFNPNKSINCQARSCALFVSLMKLNMLESAVRSPDSFMDMVSHQLSPNRLIEGKANLQQDLFVRQS